MESTETETFKVTGWGCDALFQRTNATITRCNSKGDPSNTGIYLVVYTTSKPMSVRFAADYTWVNIPPKSKYFMEIPGHGVSQKSISIVAIYTPSH